MGKHNRKTSTKLQNLNALGPIPERSQGSRDDTSQSDTQSHASVDTQLTLDTVKTDGCPSDEERADDLMFWFSEDDRPPPSKRKRERKGNATSVPITSRPRVLSAQHDAKRTPPGVVTPNAASFF